MKVGIYAPFYHPFEGGAERVARRVAQEMARRHDVVVFTLRYDPALPAEEQDGPVRVRRVPYEQSRRLGLTHLRAPALGEALRATDLDVLQIHGVIFPNLALGVARDARRRRVPTVLVTHGLYEAYLGDPRDPLLRRLLYLATVRPLLGLLLRATPHVALLAPGERDLMARLRYPEARTTVVYNGFEPPRRDAASGQRFRERHRLGDATLLLHVASVKPNKGHDVVLDALPPVAARFPTVRYVVIGGVAEPWREFAEAQRARAENGRLKDLALFLGHVSDAELADAYAAADVVLLPSRSETFPLTLLDAMAWGKPVIASDVGGVSHVLADRQNGLMVSPGDPAALAAAIEEMLADDERARLGQQAAETVDRFTWERVVERYEEICARLTRPGAATGG